MPAARAARPILAVQSLSVFDTGFILHRYRGAAPFCPRCASPPDAHGTHNRLGSNHRGAFYQLGVGHFFHGVKLALGDFVGLGNIRSSRYFGGVVWKARKYG